MRKLMLGLAAAAFAVTLNAQQLEVNNAGGALTRAGANPTVGGSYQFFNNATTWDFRVAGNPNAGYILLLGTLAASSTQPLAGVGNFEYLDLDQGLGIQVIGDGISFSGGLPGNWFITGTNGQSNWTLPVNPSFFGTTIDLQAIVTDPASVFGLNFTAAGRWAFSGGAAPLSGDDIAFTFTSVHAYPIYGAPRTQFSYCTNGHIRLSGVQSTDLSESDLEMIAGNPNANTAAPMIAPLWDDLNMVATEGRYVTVNEDTTTNTLTFTWVNARLWSPATTILGTFSCEIVDLGGYCQITLNYGALLPSPVGYAQGLIGVSDGSTVTTNNIQAELVTAGAVNPYVSTGINETYFQIFSATSGVNPPIQAVDVMGLTITFLDQDPSGGGNWFVF